MYGYFPLYVFVCLVPIGGQKMESDPLELELLTAVIH